MSAVSKKTSGMAKTFMTPGLCAVLCVGMAVGLSGAACDTTNPPPVDTCEGFSGNGGPPLLQNDHVLGSPSAPLTVIEYGDLQCPFCGQFARNTFPTIKANYIDTGKVRWVFRHFPLRNIHANAEVAAQASECASDQGKFWEFVDGVYANQLILADANGTAVAAATAKANLKTLAGNVGCSNATFDPCLDGGGKSSRVQQDVDNGAALGIGTIPGSGTPAFFVGNNEPFFGGLGTAAFSQRLDEALACTGN